MTGMPERLHGNTLAEAICALTISKGADRARCEGMLFWRPESDAPTSTVRPASLVFVGAGEKRGVLGGETIECDPHHYLGLLSPLPIVCATDASWARNGLGTPEPPALTFVAEIDLALLRELVAVLGPQGAGEPPPAVPRAFRAKLEPVVEETVRRLLSHLQDERAARLLGPQTLRELLFYVLRGPHGDALRSLARMGVGPTSQLSAVMRHIVEHHPERLLVEDLAKLAHMSVPTFHHHFKAMTSSSPLQYVKGVRLTRAKQLLQAGSTVKRAAHDVGYGSESQFSREFRRFFGVCPSDCVPH